MSQMKRITKSDLESLVAYLNKMTGSPLETYKQVTVANPKIGENPLATKFVAQVGNFHLDGAYGGWKLGRISNESGGMHDVLSCGYVSKSELYHLIHAYKLGLEMAAV